MHSIRNIFLKLFLLVFIQMFTISVLAQRNQNYVLALDKNWKLQPFGEWTEDGKTLIKPNIYTKKNSISCNVPTTVLGAFVNQGKVKDPFFADNIERIPKEWFKSQWRFSKTIVIDKQFSGLYSRLCFEGINYSADVYLNGTKIASKDTLAGAFRRFEIDITKVIKTGSNKLVVIVFPPQPGNYTIGFVDWTPPPTDKNMGLFRPVSIRFNGTISINQPFVKSKILNAKTGESELTIEALVINHSASEVKTNINLAFDEVKINRTISLKANESQLVRWNPEMNPQLKLKNAKLWWPVTMGKPDMYSLKLTSSVENKITDISITKFGIREVTDYLDKNGYRFYKINGQNLQIRGGGWTDDLFLRETPENVEAQLQYTKLMNLNCIRLEGFWGTSSILYDLCDKYGILLMAGWSCQWEHQKYLGKAVDDFGGIVTAQDIDLVARSLVDQIVWLRNHPSLFVWALASDKISRPELEKRYIKDLSIVDPTRPFLNSCAVLKSPITGPSGVKMEGPYDYVTPNYWYTDTKRGGAYGFNTETGPGPQIPPIESLKKMIPADQLWPINSMWNYHCARAVFNDINRYLNALNHRYGEAQSLDEFLMKAQMMNYEAIRPMFESFAVNRATAGGIVQWMLNASWPKLYWQLYDYYLMPNAAFFGTQTALKPLNLIYNYGDKNVYVTNDYRTNQYGLIAEIKVFDINSNVVLAKTVKFDVSEYQSKKIFSLAEIGEISTTYFVDLRLKSTDNKSITQSFYWLSTKNDVIDFPNSEWYFTPNTAFADFSGLKLMPKVKITYEKSQKVIGNKTVIDLKLKNPTDKIAFFIEMKAKNNQNNEVILPVFWSDNYISLLPGEVRSIKLEMNNSDVKGNVSLDIKGFNCEP